MKTKKQRNRKKFRKLKKQLNKPVEERIAPTPERIAKGDLEFLENKTFKSINATEIDNWYNRGLLGQVPKSMYRRDAYMALHNLCVATSMFSADVVEFSPLKFGNALDDDEVSALDKFRRILAKCSNRRNAEILVYLCSKPTEPIPYSSYAVQEALDDVIEGIEGMRRKAA
jgi:predicted TIM-barrel fold metal-dependent hydrolase